MNAKTAVTKIANGLINEVSNSIEVELKGFQKGNTAEINKKYKGTKREMLLEVLSDLSVEEYSKILNEDEEILMDVRAKIANYIRLSIENDVKESYAKVTKYVENGYKLKDIKYKDKVSEIEISKGKEKVKLYGYYDGKKFKYGIKIK